MQGQRLSSRARSQRLKAGNLRLVMSVWKALADGDVEKDRKKFASYRKCTSVYCRYWEGGATIGGLAVSV